MTARTNLPDTLSNSLAELAAGIRSEHDACISALERGLEHAVAAGKSLIEAKDQIPHGQWLTWLRDNVQIPERTAQRYMAVAPYAPEIKSDKLADLTGEAVAALAPPRPFDQAETYEELSAAVERFLDEPFTDQDGDSWDWFKTKLMHQAGVPALADSMLSAMEDDRSALRLCPYDELEAACKALAPIAQGDRALKVDCESMEAMRRVISTIELLSAWLLGVLLNEIDHRHRIDEETYAAEWKEAHALFMARIEEKIASHEAAQ